MRHLGSLTAATLFAVVLAVGTSTAADAPEPSAPPEPIAVTGFGTKAPVTFDHRKHAGEGFDCVSCHHETPEKTYRCGECHGLEAQGPVLKIRDVMHGKDKGVCYECHLVKGAPQKFKCSDCHTK